MNPVDPSFGSSLFISSFSSFLCSINFQQMRTKHTINSHIHVTISYEAAALKHHLVYICEYESVTVITVC
jgi:hypothetical protein